MWLDVRVRRALSVAGTLAVIALASLAPAQTVDKDPTTKKDVLDRMTRLIERNAYVPGVDFTQWPKFLEKVQPQVEKAKSDDEFAMAVNGGLRSFGFSHIALQTPRDGGIFKTGTTVGIGITSMIVADGVLVVRVVQGASADDAGLVPGDIITKVNGKPAKGISNIIGEEGTKVKLTVKHADGKSKDYTLLRKRFSTLRTEEVEWINKDTARLSIFTFGPGYDAKHVERLIGEVRHAPNLILDLRDNGGGAVMNLQHLLGQLMLSDKPVGTFVTKDMVDGYAKAHEGKSGEVKEIAAWSRDSRDYYFQQIRPAHSERDPYKGKLIVLVNALSGSASEIAATALKEIEGATVMGTKSAGAVLVSVIVPTGHGFMLQYPLSDYVSEGGVRLEGVGVTPDVLTEEPRVRLPGQPDETVLKAVMAFDNLKTRDVVASTNPR